ncbi:MAG: beta-propeller fold lactonase family protein [Candidatus Eremiobacteraeota bacterium]|nr:beta-propeller fold lactonase family protein [Candidatus Eremiobacteraeota bacterium]
MRIPRFIQFGLLALAICLAAGCDTSNDNNTGTTSSTGTGNTPIAPKAVYTLTNEATNRVRAFTRSTTGALTFLNNFATGGSGTAGGLNGSSGAVVFQANTNRLFAVNAVSNSVTMMLLGIDGTLTPVSTVNSGGVRPISVTVSGDLVYVLNFGDGGANAANISGFAVSGNQLVPIPNSTQLLSQVNPNPAQIGFHPSGTVLVVTERATNQIMTFPLVGGVAQAGTAQASQGATPFGFSFTSTGVLVVSEAQGGAANGSTVSSYLVGVNGTLTPVTAALANNQTGACWVAIAPGVPFAFVTNTGSNSVSVYQIAANGGLTLLAGGNSGTTGANPIDLAISDDNLFVYTLNGGDQTISAFGLAANGTLTPLPGAAGLPASSVGLVAR